MSFDELKLERMEPLNKTSFNLQLPDNENKSMSSIDSKRSFYSIANQNIVQLNFIKNLNDGKLSNNTKSKFDSGLESKTIKIDRKVRIGQKSKVFSYFPIENSQQLPRVSTFRNDQKKCCNLLPCGSIAKLSAIHSIEPVRLSSSIMPSITSKPLAASSMSNKNMFFPLLVGRNDSSTRKASKISLRTDTDGVYFLQSFKYLNKI